MAAAEPLNYDAGWWEQVYPPNEHAGGNGRAPYWPPPNYPQDWEEGWAWDPYLQDWVLAEDPAPRYVAREPQYRAHMARLPADAPQNISYGGYSINFASGHTLLKADTVDYFFFPADQSPVNHPHLGHWNSTAGTFFLDMSLKVFMQALGIADNNNRKQNGLSFILDVGDGRWYEYHRVIFDSKASDATLRNCGFFPDPYGKPARIVEFRA